jgi:hypothetical protein
VNTTITAAELAHRVEESSLARLDAATAKRFLKDWRAMGIAEERDGRWRLTKSGRAMFAGWTELPVDDEEHVA